MHATTAFRAWATHSALPYKRPRLLRSTAPTLPPRLPSDNKQPHKRHGTGQLDHTGPNQPLRDPLCPGGPIPRGWGWGPWGLRSAGRCSGIPPPPKSAALFALVHCICDAPSEVLGGSSCLRFLCPPHSQRLVALHLTAPVICHRGGMRPSGGMISAAHPRVPRMCTRSRGPHLKCRGGGLHHRTLAGFSTALGRALDNVGREA